MLETIPSEELIAELLRRLGEDPAREGLKKTPHRYFEALKSICSGLKQDPDAIGKSALFSEKATGVIELRDIEIYSLCEHHFLPFFGVVHVIYEPQDKIIGISKIARIVDAYAKRPQVQERLTRQIAEQLHKSLKPKCVTVEIHAQHLCMMMRGVHKKGAIMKTRYVV